MEEGAVGQRHPLPFTARGMKRRLSFDPQIIPPLNLSWPWKARLMRASESSAISGASPSRQCWSVKHRGDLPRQAFASHAAQKWHPPLLFGYSVYYIPIFFPVGPPTPPPHQPFPRAIVAETKRKDGWCCFELWHVSMQVNPLLFINNWPGPSVPAIYRADCCFAREHKRWERYSSTFPHSENHMNSFLNSASDKLLDLRRLQARIVAWCTRRKPSSLSRSLSEEFKASL